MHQLLHLLLVDNPADLDIARYLTSPSIADPCSSSAEVSLRVAGLLCGKSTAIATFPDCGVQVLQKLLQLMALSSRGNASKHHDNMVGTVDENNASLAVPVKKL